MTLAGLPVVIEHPAFEVGFRGLRSLSLAALEIILVPVQSDAHER
jgi:hypothetical protein